MSATLPGVSTTGTRCWRKHACPCIDVGVMCSLQAEPVVARQKRNASAYPRRIEFSRRDAPFTGYWQVLDPVVACSLDSGVSASQHDSGSCVIDGTSP